MSVSYTELANMTQDPGNGIVPPHDDHADHHHGHRACKPGCLCDDCRFTATSGQLQPAFPAGSGQCSRPDSRGRTYLCTVCEQDFAVPTILLLNGDYTLFGSGMIGHVRTYTDPAAYLINVADAFYAQSYNAWAITHNDHATGTSPAPLVLPPQTPAATADLDFVLNTTRLIGAFLIGLTRQVIQTKAQEVTINTFNLFGHSDGVSSVLRDVQIKVPAEIMKDGYILVGLPFLPPSRTDDPVAFWCQAPVSAGVRLRVRNIPADTTVSPVVVTPGSLSARVTATAWQNANLMTPVVSK